MTLAELSDAAERQARDAWYTARSVYQQASEKVGKFARTAQRELPKNLRGLKEFLANSQRGMKYLDDNAATSRENVQEMLRNLDRRK